MSLPRVELPEASVKVLQCSNEEPPTVDTHTRVVVEVRVQYEHRVQLLTVLESSHQSWVVMQPESFVEPVNTCVSHTCGHVNHKHKAPKHQVSDLQ